MQKFIPSKLTNSKEFDLIKKYFTNRKNQKIIGDDCAVLGIDENHQLLNTIDSMVEGVHFLSKDNPFALGYKLMAVNLSDIAAMGGIPKWASLTISLNNVNEKWLQKFSEGLFSLANEYDVNLVGGDTTKSEILSFSVNLFGVVKKNQAILRSTCKPDDLILVSGSLGGASFALQQKLNGIKTQAIKYLEYPKPQIHLGQNLSNIASAMIDVSDGLLQDLSHLLNKSKVGAVIDANKIPFVKEIENNPRKYNFALTGGEDYQLLFTINESKLNLLKKLNVSVIGRITKNQELIIENCPVEISQAGFNHF